MTLWQACVSVVHAFPQSPDVLAIGNALAEEEECDPSAQPLHEAAVSSSQPATSGIGRRTDSLDRFWEQQRHTKVHGRLEWL